jgi:hypothetical protein
MTSRNAVVLFIHGLVGWALCAATMGIGMATTTPQTALIIHAVAAPIFFAAVSSVYFGRFHYSSPLATAAVFVLFVIIVDFLVVGLLILRSLAMFESVLGTWLPFALIFGSTFLTGAVFSLIRKPRTASA